MAKLIYIGGYGHSGSTLLESLLAESPEVLACGEVTSCIRAGTRKGNRKCSCGREAYVCPVWGFYFASPNPPDGWTHAKLLTTLMQRWSARYTAIVDSSKTAWGSLTAPFRLKQQFGRDFVLVHLIRNPAAASWSVLKQKKRRAQREGRRLRFLQLRSAWTAIGWCAANLSCELFGLLYPRNYVRIRYEDLVRAPKEERHRLKQHLLPQGAPNSESLPADNRHQLHGNKVRMRQLTVADVHEDRNWRSEMPPVYARLVLVFSWPLRLRYGYGASRAAGA